MLDIGVYYRKKKRNMEGIGIGIEFFVLVFIEENI